MTSELSPAAAALDAARRGPHALGPLPPGAAPADIDAAYRVQAELARRFGGVAGWKVAALTAAQQAKQGYARPIAGRLFGDFVQPSPAWFSRGRFLTPNLECEFAYALGRDLPPRAAPYARDEVAAAVAALVLAIEIGDTRVGEAPPLPLRVADGVGNGAFVVGPRLTDWRGLDLSRQAVALRVNGREVARGTWAAIADGDPLMAVAILANSQPPGGEGLKAGQIVTTGSVTGVYPGMAGEEAVAVFAGLGEVRVSFTP